MTFPHDWSLLMKAHMPEPRREICGGCKSEIDPDWCWCGGAVDKHTWGDGHSPVPMGCVCHYEDRDAKP